MLQELEQQGSWIIEGGKVLLGCGGIGRRWFRWLAAFLALPAGHGV